MVLSSLVLVAACGTKGPLVLPGKETPAAKIEPVELPRDADAARDTGDEGEPADAAKPSEPPADE
jgi:predicted small lipoprotein YifL